MTLVVTAHYLLCQNSLSSLVLGFPYLGSMVASSPNDFKRRKAVRWSSLWGLDNWYSQSIPLDLKLRLFRTTCVLLHVCEVWIIIKDMGAKLNAFTTSCYRIMLNIKRLNKLSNDRIYDPDRHQPFVVDSHLATA